MSNADVNGLSLHYQEHGDDGETLVMLHGGFGTGDSFGPVLDELAATRRVITPDLQAHGGTADIDRPMRFEAMADDIAGLIRHLGLDQADVLGYSLGGGAALRLAIQHPRLVRRLVVLSAPPNATAGTRKSGPASTGWDASLSRCSSSRRCIPRTRRWRRGLRTSPS
ncbi:MAG TPA: alpha/beta hydrolase [Streptosporangiaceae bacterium]